MTLRILLSFVLSACFLLADSPRLNAAAWQWKASLYAPKEIGPMSFPASMYVDAERQRYYAVDTGNNRLLSFDREGNFINEFQADGRMKAPAAMSREGDDTLWVVEKGKNAISKIGLKSRNVASQAITDQGRTVVPGRFLRQDGAAYLLDRASGAVLRLASDLSVERRFAAADHPAGFVDFTISGASLLALTRKPDRIYRYPLAGGEGTNIALQEPMTMPVSLAIDDTGRIYILDRHQADIAVFGPDGRLAYRFLGRGHSQGKLFFPARIDFDAWGNLCVVDEGNGRIEIYGR